MATVDRFSRYIPVPESGCWIWEGPVSRRGYGVMALGTRAKRSFAHRAFYSHFVGPIPEGMFVCHKCDTPPCVNPNHLFVGTIQDNNEDRRAKGRCKGEWNGRAKLTAADVLTIRASGLPKKQIARRFGVSPKTVRDIKHRETWSFLK